MNSNSTLSITETVQQFGNKLFGFIRGKVKTDEDAEDILQDVWYQLSNVYDGSELENVSAWLYKVARNKVTDKYRKKSNTLIDDYSFEQEGDEIGFKDLLLLDDSHDPELKLFKDEFWNELMNALDELPDKQREVFILHEMEDFTLQEIADQMGENLKTIISRKGYATKYLRTKLGYLYQDLNL